MNIQLPTMLVLLFIPVTGALRRVPAHLCLQPQKNQPSLAGSSLLPLKFVLRGPLLLHSLLLLATFFPFPTASFPFPFISPSRKCFTQTPSTL